VFWGVGVRGESGWEASASDHRSWCTRGWPYLVASQCDTMKNYEKIWGKTTFKTAKNYSHHRVMIPMHTRDTTGTGHGMPQCAKIDYRTHTRTTHFGKPTGFPLPMANPTIDEHHRFLCAYSDLPWSSPTHCDILRFASSDVWAAPLSVFGIFLSPFLDFCQTIYPITFPFCPIYCDVFAF
jgi:hypothetical protein